MTKLTLETCYGTYSVSVDRDDLSLPELLGDITRSVLAAAGYSDKLIIEYLENAINEN